MGFGEMIVFAEAETGQDRTGLFVDGDFSIQSASSADSVRKLLDDSWTVDLVVADMRVVDEALLDRLQSKNAPPALFLVDRDETAVEGISMAANVRGYLDLPVTDEALRDAILAALPSVRPKGVADFSDRDSARLNALGRDVERIARALNDFATEASSEPKREAISAAFVRAVA
jgi:DNA-binding response OmpR family regulator